MPTPKLLKILLLLMTILTFGLACMPQITPLLGLSKDGIEHFFYWQWISYGLFEFSDNGITFSLIFQLGFSLYLLWIFGSSLINRLGNSRFFALFISSTLIGGLTSWAVLISLHSPLLFISSTPALYTCLFAWTFLNADAKVLLFFIIPFNVCRALYIFIGITLLIDLSHGDWPGSAGLIASIIYTYLFVLVSCRTLSPFSFLHPLEKTLIRWSGTLRCWKRKPSTPYHSSKIYDIRSGKPVLDDEQFMDAMLTRISLYGEDAISPEDKKRMEIISRRKKEK